MMEVAWIMLRGMPTILPAFGPLTGRNRWSVVHLTSEDPEHIISHYRTGDDTPRTLCGRRIPGGGETWGGIHCRGAIPGPLWTRTGYRPLRRCKRCIRHRGKV